MAFAISINNNIYELNGNLTTVNITQVKKYFEVIMQMKKVISISLENVQKIDVPSLYELRNLMLYAKTKVRKINYINRPGNVVEKIIEDERLDFFCFNYLKISA